MKTLFIATVVVYKEYYMQDHGTKSTETRLVEAESEKEARQKIEKHYNDKTCEYDVYYSVSIEDISELIR
jgi:hypothetical protein